MSAHFLGRLGINVSVIGNHEFDWGPGKLVDYLGMLPFPVVGACNLDVPSGHALGKRLRVYTSHTMLGAKVSVADLSTHSWTGL
jgi:2',3'-cyclic-nucleotide 2'-phosphodiesterase (5'-nucleotidase family)